MNNPFANPEKQVRALAVEDAARGQNHVGEYIAKELGPRPAFSPALDVEHQRLFYQSRTEDVEALQVQATTVADQRVHHLSITVLLLLFFLVLGIEFESGVLYWQEQGITGARREVLAFGTADTTVFLTWAVARIARQILPKE